MPLVNEKILTLKNKITCRSVKSIFSEHEVKNTMFSLKEDFVIVAIDKAANNVAFIYKHFYALTIKTNYILIVIYQTRMIITPTHL